ncbi:hypothetical protein BD309DRAFT_384235 [Dichomitus squalens]|nr:hypothetical protein BD309DRAFT_384235 [Dichomitus squalens]
MDGLQEHFVPVHSQSGTEDRDALHDADLSRDNMVVDHGTLTSRSSSHIAEDPPTHWPTLDKDPISAVFGGSRVRRARVCYIAQRLRQPCMEPRADRARPSRKRRDERICLRFRTSSFENWGETWACQLELLPEKTSVRGSSLSCVALIGYRNSCHPLAALHLLCL